MVILTFRNGKWLLLWSFRIEVHECSTALPLLVFLELNIKSHKVAKKIPPWDVKSCFNQKRKKKSTTLPTAKPDT